MITTETKYAHIVLDEQGRPRIAGTGFKVVMLVMAQQAYGWSPDELVEQFPALSLGQVHSALAYYADHRQEMDAEIARRGDDAEAMRAASSQPPLLERLRAMKQG